MHVYIQLIREGRLQRSKKIYEAKIYEADRHEGVWLLTLREPFCSEKDFCRGMVTLSFFCFFVYLFYCSRRLDHASLVVLEPERAFINIRENGPVNMDKDMQV